MAAYGHNPSQVRQPPHLLGDDMRSEWLQGDRAGIHQREGCRSCGAALGHAIGDILGSLAGASQKDPVGGRFHRCQFGVFLEEETIRAETDPESPGHLWADPDWGSIPVLSTTISTRVSL